MVLRGMTSRPVFFTRRNYVSRPRAASVREKFHKKFCRDYAGVPPISGNYRDTLERRMTVDVKIMPVI